jgi:hypothetical protein
MEHHYKEPNLGFGVTSPFWDWVFSMSSLLLLPPTFFSLVLLPFAAYSELTIFPLN